MKLLIFILIVCMMNFYGFICHPEMTRALIAMDLLSFAMALAIIYADIMASDKNG